MVSHSLSPAIWVRTAFCSEGNFMPAMEVNRPSNLRTCAASTVTLQSQAKSILPGHADLAPRCVSDRFLPHRLVAFTAGPYSKRSTELGSFILTFHWTRTRWQIPPPITRQHSEHTRTAAPAMASYLQNGNQGPCSEHDHLDGMFV